MTWLNGETFLSLGRKGDKNGLRLKKYREDRFVTIT